MLSSWISSSWSPSWMVKGLNLMARLMVFMWAFSGCCRLKL
jgi:hypothetical protein